MSPELLGEILAQRLIAGSTYLPHMNRIIRKLGRLLAGADYLREATKTAETP